MRCKYPVLKYYIILLFMLFSCGTWCQVTVPVDSLKADSLRIKALKATASPDNLDQQYDVSDLFHTILHPGKKTAAATKRSAVTVIPNIAANPTIGFQAGIKAVAGKRLGNDPKTLFSVAATSA